MAGIKPRLLSARHDRQACDRSQAGPLAPSDLRVGHSQLEFRPALEQRLQRAFAFDARELMPQAEVDSCPEGQMPVGSPFEIEPFGMLIGIRVHVGHRQHGHDLLALLHLHAAKVHVLAHEARFGKLYWRDETIARLARLQSPSSQSRKLGFLVSS